MEPPTLEELVKEVGISLDQLDRRCSDEHLNSISLFLDCNWRNVSPHLGLNKRDIEDIESEKRTEPEKRLAALQKWKAKYSFMATLKSLVVVLLKMESADDAEKVCRHLQSQAQREVVVPPKDDDITVPDPKKRKLDVQLAEEGSTLGRVADLPSQGSPQSVVEHTDEPPSTTCAVPGPIPHFHVPAQCTIEKEVEELEDQFLNVVRKAAKDLRTVDLSDIKLCITQLPVSVKYQHCKFLECKRDDITNAQSVDAIFAILSPYWDFWNCGLLKEIVRKLGNEATQQLMGRYTENLRRFRMNTKLGDFIGKWAGSTAPHFTVFVTKMRGEWQDKTLEDLEEFRQELARSMYVKEYALHFSSFEPGSIAVTWAIHSSFQDRHVPDLKSLESPPLATPLAPLSPPTPPEESEQENFDMISALLSAGVPHIPEQILECLDGRSLVMSEQVSILWRDTVSELSWKHLVENNTDSNKLWRALFQRRGWSKYLDVSFSKQISSHFYRHLYQSASRDIHSLETNWRRGHYTLTKIETGSAVVCLQCDDDKIVTGHGDGDFTIKIWDRSTLQVSKVLEGHKSDVTCLKYDETVVISGSWDLTVKVWDIQTGLMVNELHHKNTVYSLKFSKQTLVTGSLDDTVVWDVKSPTDITLRAVLKGHERIVYAVELNEVNIFSGSSDDTIQVWNTFTGGLVRTLHGHSDAVICLQLRRSHLISGSYDKTIRIWNIDSGGCVRVMYGHDDLVMCVAMDDHRILSGSVDKTVKVWDLAAALDSGSSSDALCITTLKEHTRWVYGVSLDQFQVISVSTDKTLVIYDFLNPILRT